MIAMGILFAYHLQVFRSIMAWLGKVGITLLNGHENEVSDSLYRNLWPAAGQKATSKGQGGLLRGERWSHSSHE
jgi:hypothetical protein